MPLFCLPFISPPIQVTLSSIRVNPSGPALRLLLLLLWADAISCSSSFSSSASSSSQLFFFSLHFSPGFFHFQEESRSVSLSGKGSPLIEKNYFPKPFFYSVSYQNHQLSVSIRHYTTHPTITTPFSPREVISKVRGPPRVQKLPFSK